MNYLGYGGKAVTGTEQDEPNARDAGKRNERPAVFNDQIPASSAEACKGRQWQGYCGFFI